MILLIWASTLERATNCLASAINPEVATPTWLSILNLFNGFWNNQSADDSFVANKYYSVFKLQSGCCGSSLDRFSAYSTWNSLPSGPVAIPWSYPLPLGCIISPVYSSSRHFMSIRVTTLCLPSVYYRLSDHYNPHEHIIKLLSNQFSDIS